MSHADNAEYFVSMFAKHAPVTLADLRNAAQSSAGHVEDTIMDIRGDLDDKYTNAAEADHGFACRGWSKERRAEVSGVRFAMSCALDHWPSMTALRDALLASV
jgi:hypothetical protein